MSTAEVPQTRSVDLVKLLVPIWGAGLLLFYGSVALFNEDAFSSGGALLLLISIGVGASLLLYTVASTRQRPGCARAGVPVGRDERHPASP